jgi:hypothetical protein
MSDYLPAPYGLPGFAAPVEQIYPVLTPQIELADGRVVTATDGADAIEPAADGRSLRARWKKFAVVGTQSVQLEDVGLTSEVTWHIERNTLVREEVLSSTKPVPVRFWKLVVPTSYDEVHTEYKKGARADIFFSQQGKLKVEADATFVLVASIKAPGDGPLGKGVHGAVPLHLEFSSRNLLVNPEQSLKFKITLSVSRGEDK